MCTGEAHSAWSDARAVRRVQAFVADECGAVDPLLEELLVNGRFGNATEITLRVGGATGERMVITDGAVDTVLVPDDVLVASADDPGGSAIHHVIAGKTWRVSAQSFFQTSHAGAEALVAAVGRGLGTIWDQMCRSCSPELSDGLRPPFRR